MEYKVLTGEEYPDMSENLCTIDWPEFILHDPIAERYWTSLFNKFPTYQFALFDGDTMAGYANAIPLKMDLDDMDYNDHGWDWALEKGFEGFTSQEKPTVLCGLQIGISSHYKGKGISILLVEGMRNIALQNNLKALILPLRPTLKHHYPLLDMNEYIGWKTKSGRVYDPWIRTHVQCGAEIVSVCKKAMYIPGTVAEWELWTGLSFQTSGDYIINGALSPIMVSLERNLVEYIEPNVWVIHKL